MAETRKLADIEIDNNVALTEFIKEFREIALDVEFSMYAAAEELKERLTSLPGSKDLSPAARASKVSSHMFVSADLIREALVSAVKTLYSFENMYQEEIDMARGKARRDFDII